MTAAPCPRESHAAWFVMLDEHGRPHAIACAGCMATVPAPDLEVEPGVRQVELPAGWEDEDDEPSGRGRVRNGAKSYVAVSSQSDPVSPGHHLFSPESQASGATGSLSPAYRPTHRHAHRVGKGRPLPSRR